MGEQGHIAKMNIIFSLAIHLYSFPIRLRSPQTATILDACEVGSGPRQRWEEVSMIITVIELELKPVARELPDKPEIYVSA